MKDFNINDYVLVQITEYGWQELKKSVGDEYIKHCIKSKEQKINGEYWYRMQGHQMITLFGSMLFFTVPHPIKSNIKIEL